MALSEQAEADRIRVGLHALGIGPGSKPQVIAAVASAADRLGLAALWCGKHVVMVDASAWLRAARI